ncbi:hypothetical protein BCR42DRAFT_371056 [Absidia repens]|uniref:Pentacotripeptide-repeat region of PRORP domain-containing protein n=1 Tax=Absidia repens TaxID=90262 RepID=A0A1X2IN80_9FUNG|nr:hypothetical protein BCR42DRAFT_371056 [Absidia repens]
MHCVKGSMLLNTRTRQRAIPKQLATLLTSNKTATFITTAPTRSRKLYTTWNDSGSNLVDQRPFDNLLTCATHIPSGSFSRTMRRQYRQQLRFKTTSVLPASLDSTDYDPNACISHFAQLEDYKAVISEFKTVEHLDTPLTTETYQAVMEAYGTLPMDAKNMTDMMNAYNEMLTRGVLPTSEIYAVIIGSLCARDGIVNSTTNAIHRQMDIDSYDTKGNMQLHPISVENLMKSRSSLGALKSEKNLQRAVTIFEQAVSEGKTKAFDVGLYNNLLHGLSYTGNTQDGLFIYEQLENSQVRPNITTFARLLSLFGNAGDLQAVEECFKEYKNVYRGIPAHDQVYIYNALVSAHANAGDLDGALHLLEKSMVKAHIPVTISSYNKILYRACLDNNMELVSHVVDKLNLDNQLPKPDSNTYGILLSMYSRTRNMGKAHEVFDKVMSMNLDRQYGHLNEYVAACVDENELGRSMDIIRAMSVHGLQVHINQCCRVVNGYFGTGDMRGAAAAVKEIIQLQSKTYHIGNTSPLVALCMDVVQRTDNLVDALDILRVLNLYSIRLDNPGSEAVLKLYDQTKTDSLKWNEFVDYCTDRSYFTLYEAAFKAHHDANQFSKTAFQLLKDMYDLNIQTNSGLYIRVGTRMNKYGTVEDKVRWEKAFGEYYPDIQNEVRQQLSTTTTKTTKTIVSSSSSSSPATTSSNSSMADVRTNEVLNLVQSGEFDKGLVLMQEKIIDQGMIPTPGAVCTMILEANKSHLVETANKMYEMVLDPFNQLDTGTRKKAMHMLNNNMMIIHSNNKDADNTKFYYDKLRSDGMYPDGDGYGALLTCATNIHANDASVEAMMIIDEAKKHNVRPTLYMYNVVISKLGKNRKMDQALALFNEMQGNGVYPDSVTYASVISTCLRYGSEAQATKYFDEMTRLPNCRPRISAYNSMIQYYVRERGDRKQAMVYFEKLKTTHLVPSIHTFRLLIEAYANTPDYDMVAACNVLTDMKNQFGQDAVASHYATLIHSYGCIHRDVASAEAMLDKMTRAGIPSNEPVYRALLDTYISHGNIPKAEALYQTMLDANLRSSPYIESLFIQGYGDNDAVDKAEHVFNRTSDERSADGGGVIREPSTYEAMVKVYMNHGQIDKATQVRNRMKQCGFPIKVVDGVSLLIEQGQA